MKGIMNIIPDFNAACEWCDPVDEPFEYPVSVMELGGIETMVTVAEAENPVATIHFVKGFKSHPVYYKELLDDMTAAGINVVLVTLPDPGEHVDFIEEYEGLVHAVYAEGALDHLVDDTVPRIAAGHSTGAFLFAKMLTKDVLAKTISERYESSFSAAPFFGSKHHNRPLLGRLARLYSTLFADTPVGNTWMERLLSKSELADRKDIKMLANHRQALYMDQPTQEFMKHIREHGFSKHARDIDHKFVLGMRDDVSHNGLSREVAQMLDARVIELVGGHSTVRKRPAGRNLLQYHVYKTLQKLQATHPGSPANSNDIDPSTPNFEIA